MKTLCGMSTDELASSHLQEERKRIRTESYAGHLRQEDEGNEIVYKDGALQKIAKVKSDAKKQVLVSPAAAARSAAAASAAAARSAAAKSASAIAEEGSDDDGGDRKGSSGSKAGRKGRRGSGGNGVSGSGVVSVSVKGEGGFAEDGYARRSGGDNDDDDNGDEEEHEGRIDLSGSDGGKRRGSGVGAELKRRLSSSSDVGSVGDGLEGSAAKRAKKLSVSSPIIDDVPK